MDIFDLKNVEPMLIKKQLEPFSDPDWIFELKLDGIRCIAYFDGTTVDLRNKKGVVLLPRFPELSDIYRSVKRKCILDGELIILNGTPDFYELQRRTILSDRFKIQLAYKSLPASFVAYDILYLDDKEVISLPLLERKNILGETVKENSSIAISRYISEFGVELYNIADERKLEGVVAKRKSSRYYYGKRSSDWVKFKRLVEEDAIVCGFVRKHMNVLILGKYEGERLVYRGSVSFGVRLDFLKDYSCSVVPYSPFTGKADDMAGDERDIQWISPLLVCTVTYMPNTKNSLRQPVFKGIRDDISLQDLMKN